MSRFGIPFLPTDGPRIPPRVMVHGVTGDVEAIEAAIEPYKRAVFQIYAGYRLQRSQSIIEMDQYMVRMDQNVTLRINTIQGVDILNLYVNKVEVEEEEGIEIYLESGALEFTFPGQSNPTRLSPAKWNFVSSRTGIVGDDPAIGYYLDDVTYVDGSDSIAIGKTAGEGTVLKKIVCGMFPPSLFSGLMRAYMQAQYGANNEEEFKFSVDLVGTEPVLKNNTVQMTYYAHNTVGIVKRGDYDYILVVIAAPNSEEFTVTGYPLVFTEDAITVAKQLYSDGYSEKSIAYLFAYASFDKDNPISMGVFSLSNVGGAMAYGWKFNNAGNRASIVIIDSYDYPERYRSNIVHVDFSFESPSDSGTVSKSETAPISWIDVPWHKMFVPSYDSITWGTCDYYTLAMNGPASPSRTLYASMTWSDAPLYCFYDKNDNFILLTCSHANTTHSETRLDYSNIIPATIPPTNLSEIESGWRMANESGWYSQHTITHDYTTTFNLNGVNYVGDGVSGTYFRHIANPPGSGYVDGVLDYFPNAISTYSPPTNTPTYDALIAVYDGRIDTVTIVNRIFGTAVYTDISGTFIDATGVNIHIPSGDCEAVYLATNRVIDPSADATTEVNVVNDAPANFDVSIYDDGVLVANMIHIPWADAGYNGSGTVSDTSYPETQAIVYENPEMFTSTRTLNNAQSEYIGSTATYFGHRLDAIFPPASKWVYESSGGVTVGSDVGNNGLTESPGIWVGWA